jgi:hypothetical protein
MDTNSFALPGLLAALLLAALLLFVGVQPGAAERTASSPMLFTATPDTQHIHLTPGWNYVAARVTPEATDFELLFGDLAEVPLVSDGNGGMYYPASSLNTTGAWDTQRGYFVYAEGSETLVLEGAPLSSETSFSLEAGWNLVPFVLPDPMDAEEAFAGIADQLLMAKDDDGQTFIPESGINAIGALRPGRAYQLFVSEPVELSYSSFAPPQEFVYDQECLDSHNSHRLHDYQDAYGTLTQGPLDRSIAADSVAIDNNTALINGVINDLVGPAGGGVVCLPEGRYDVAPANLWSDDNRSLVSSIFIDHSNITLWGAGRDEGGTGLYSNGTWVEPEGVEVRRGTGLTIGQFGRTPARTNITLRDFELNGQGALPGDSTAYTGCDNWRSRDAKINCWDTSHKGINFNRNGAIDAEDIFVERVAIRSFKGEMLYTGGQSMRGVLSFDDIISEDTNAQALNVHGEDVQVHNSYFGLSMTWQELFGGFENKSGTFTNNTFDQCHKDFCITVTQGDNSTVPFTFENNHFTGCVFHNPSNTNAQVFAFGSGTDGPIDIRNNTFENCGLMKAAIVGGGQDAQTPRNILFENNELTFTENKRAISFEGDVHDVTVRNNTFTWEEGAAGNQSYPFSLGWSSYTGSIIENNTFINERWINFDGGGPTMLPLIRDNNYSYALPGAWRSEGQGIGFNSERYRIRPRSDYSTVPVIGTDRYPDGFEVTIDISTGGERDDVTFVAGNATYEVAEDRTLTASGGETITFVYDATQEKWIEVISGE